MIDAIGFAAASLVLATFCMRTMGALRWVALASNLVFIAYGYLGNLAPVLLLHALLLPVNAYRLTQLCGASDARSEGTEQKAATMTGNGGKVRHSARTVAALAPLIFTFAVLAADAAHAHSVRYVSATGSDSNNCTRAAPCLTLQRGIDRTAAGSELIVLDSGDFGDGATIDKSITISAIGVSATVGGGITINGDGVTVVLRGLRLNGAGAGGPGVRINNAAAVHIVDCAIHNFAGAGIAAQTAAAVNMFVSGCVVRNNSFDGLFFAPGAGGALGVDNSRFERNGINSSYSGLKINAGEARISRSMTTMNFGDGIRVFGGTVNITWTTAAHNGGSGFLVSGSGAMTVEQSVARGNGLHGVRVSQTTSTGVLAGSVVTNNGIGVAAAAGNKLWTRGNSTVSGNMTDVSGTLQPFSAR
jgi:hypothetical protein